MISWAVPDFSPVIQARRLSCHYGSFQALESISFSVCPGEKIALVGANGAGKTSLLKLLAGLQEPSSGHLSLFRYRPRSLEARRRVAYLPEDNPLPLAFRVKEYLEDRLHFYGRKRKDLHEILEILDLLEYRKRIIAQLSHGTRRRVGLAATLITGADILLLDEPTSGLDPRQNRHLRSLLKNLEGKTLILSTHILPDAESICRRSLLLHLGKLLYDGPVNEVDRKFREIVG
jgi:ABC-2 type transport system ATP-binding protein